MSDSEADPIVGPARALIDAVNRGDESAIRSLLNRYEGLVRASVRLFFRRADEDDAEDVRNMMRLELVRCLKNWDPERPFDLYFFGVAANVVRKFIRSQPKFTTPFSDLSRPGQPDFDAEDERYDELEYAGPLSSYYDAYKVVVEKLTPNQKIVLDHTLRNAPHAALAQALNISEEAAKQHRYRLNEKLRREITKLMGAAKP